MSYSLGTHGSVSFSGSLSTELISSWVCRAVLVPCLMRLLLETNDSCSGFWWSLQWELDLPNEGFDSFFGSLGTELIPSWGCCAVLVPCLMRLLLETNGSFSEFWSSLQWELDLPNLWKDESFMIVSFEEDRWLKLPNPSIPCVSFRALALSSLRSVSLSRSFNTLSDESLTFNPQLNLLHVKNRKAY